MDYYFDPPILRQQLRFLHAATGFIISIESSTAQKTTHGTDVHSAIMTLDICVTLTHWRVDVRPHLLSLLGVHGELTLVFTDTLRDVRSFPKDCENHFCIFFCLSLSMAESILQCKCRVLKCLGHSQDIFYSFPIVYFKRGNLIFGRLQ